MAEAIRDRHGHDSADARARWSAAPRRRLDDVMPYVTKKCTVCGRKCECYHNVMKCRRCKTGDLIAEPRFQHQSMTCLKVENRGRSGGGERPPLDSDTASNTANGTTGRQLAADRAKHRVFPPKRRLNTWKIRAEFRRFLHVVVSNWRYNSTLSE